MQYNIYGCNSAVGANAFYVTGMLEKDGLPPGAKEGYLISPDDLVTHVNKLQGFIYRDVRFLSELRLLVNGEPVTITQVNSDLVTTTFAATTQNGQNITGEMRVHDGVMYVKVDHAELGAGDTLTVQTKADYEDGFYLRRYLQEPVTKSDEYIRKTNVYLDARTPVSLGNVDIPLGDGKTTTEIAIQAIQDKATETAPERQPILSYREAVTAAHTHYQEFLQRFTDIIPPDPQAKAMFQKGLHELYVLTSCYDNERLAKPLLAPQAGFPDFKTFFARDALIFCLSLLLSIPTQMNNANQDALELVRNTITILLDTMAKDGHLIHEIRDCPSCNLDIAPFNMNNHEQSCSAYDAPNLLIHLIDIFVLKTGDMSIIRDYRDKIRNVAEWNTTEIEKNNGLLAYSPLGATSLRATGWKDGGKPYPMERINKWLPRLDVRPKTDEEQIQTIRDMRKDGLGSTTLSRNPSPLNAANATEINYQSFNKYPQAYLEVQALSIASLKAMADWLEQHPSENDTLHPETLRTQAASLKKQTDAWFYLEDKGIYQEVIAVPVTGVRDTIESTGQTGSNIHYLLGSHYFDLMDDDDLDKLSCVLGKLEDPNGLLAVDEDGEVLGLRTLGKDCYGYRPYAYQQGAIWPFDTALCAEHLSNQAKAIQQALENDPDNDRLQQLQGRCANLSHALASSVIRTICRNQSFCELVHGDNAIPLPYGNNPQLWSIGAFIRALTLKQELEREYGNTFVQNLMNAGR
jgi:glycogen debranching enzyme